MRARYWSDMEFTLLDSKGRVIGNHPLVGVVHCQPDGKLVEPTDPAHDYLCWRVYAKTGIGRIGEYLVHPDQSIQCLSDMRLSVSVAEREAVMKLVQQFCQNASTQI